jgi:hypothetical protein
MFPNGSGGYKVTVSTLAEQCELSFQNYLKVKLVGLLRIKNHKPK